MTSRTSTKAESPFEDCTQYLLCLPTDIHVKNGMSASHLRVILTYCRRLWLTRIDLTHSCQECPRQRPWSSPSTYLYVLMCERDILNENDPAETSVTQYIRLSPCPRRCSTQVGNDYQISLCMQLDFSYKAAIPLPTLRPTRRE